VDGGIGVWISSSSYTPVSVLFRKPMRDTFQKLTLMAGISDPKIQLLKLNLDYDSSSLVSVKTRLACLFLLASPYLLLAVVGSPLTVVFVALPSSPSLHFEVCLTH
jgi:hypothetical protein